MIEVYHDFLSKRMTHVMTVAFFSDHFLLAFCCFYDILDLGSQWRVNVAAKLSS